MSALAILETGLMLGLYVLLAGAWGVCMHWRIFARREWSGIRPPLLMGCTPSLPSSSFWERRSAPPGNA